MLLMSSTTGVLTMKVNRQEKEVMVKALEALIFRRKGTDIESQARRLLDKVEQLGR